VSVVSWWVTWPAEPVLGNIVSDHIHMWPAAKVEGGVAPAGVTYPAELYGEVAHLVMRSEDMTREQALPFIDISERELEVLKDVPRDHARDIRRDLKGFYSTYETTRRIALAVMDVDRTRFGAPSDQLVLFRIVDWVCHTSLKHSELVTNHLDATPGEVKRYGRAVSEAYRAADRAIGQLLARFGPGNVIIVSDHGFELEDHVWGPRYNHTHAPDGIFIAAGPAFRPGRFEGLTVYDVMPLMLATKGLPVAEDLVSRVRTDVFQPSHLEQSPVRYVKSFGYSGALELGDDAPEAEAELLERLRALGYIE
jgi:hypothetical protein